MFRFGFLRSGATVALLLGALGLGKLAQGATGAGRALLVLAVFLGVLLEERAAEGGVVAGFLTNFFPTVFSVAVRAFKEVISIFVFVVCSFYPFVGVLFGFPYFFFIICFCVRFFVVVAFGYLFYLVSFVFFVLSFFFRIIVFLIFVSALFCLSVVLLFCRICLLLSFRNCFFFLSLQYRFHLLFESC